MARIVEVKHRYHPGDAQPFCLSCKNLNVTGRMELLAEPIGDAIRSVGLCDKCYSECKSAEHYERLDSLAADYRRLLESLEPVFDRSYFRVPIWVPKEGRETMLGHYLIVEAVKPKNGNGLSNPFQHVYRLFDGLIYERDRIRDVRRVYTAETPIFDSELGKRCVYDPELRIAVLRAEVLLPDGWRRHKLGDGMRFVSPSGKTNLTLTRAWGLLAGVETRCAQAIETERLNTIKEVAPVESPAKPAFPLALVQELLPGFELELRERYLYGCWPGADHDEAVLSYDTCLTDTLRWCWQERGKHVHDLILKELPGWKLEVLAAMPMYWAPTGPDGRPGLCFIPFSIDFERIPATCAGIKKSVCTMIERGGTRTALDERIDEANADAPSGVIWRAWSTPADES